MLKWGFSCTGFVGIERGGRNGSSSAWSKNVGTRIDCKKPSLLHSR
jgi:hypothetical protein